ncbi:helix-turn-helix domain-containing protein [Nocardia asteroides]|uniref:helix-turn-helix domain-containing protein n=1 Tax=Nocardia asteroides TaxID=1824 RepID=UPI001E655E64|nr:helix-turn-helix transcriptional regulator [Nocardia asteroides]UGT62866.1 helix-turn-helix transcriptional regulator [Nocardia asteroides]
MTGVEQARAALGARLRELRRDARLSGIGLAAACGWHSSKVSRIEHGKQNPTEADLATWCQAVGNLAVLDDLVASLRNMQAMYLEWQRTVAAGHAHRQRQSIKLEAQTRHVRWWEPEVVPGLLQTERYARGVLAACIAVIAGRDDLDDALAARMQRQQVLAQGDHRFHIVIGEWALYRTVGDDDVMREQLDRLTDLLAHPRVRLGVLPLLAEYRGPASNFVIYDRAKVLAETVSAELTITRPSEILLHERTFTIIAEQARYGAEADALITAAAQQRR